MAIYDFLGTTSFESLKELMLESIPEDIDTSQGSFIYNAVTPIALFTTMMFDMVKVIVDESNFASASGSNLDMIGTTKPRVYRRRATNEEIEIQVTPIVGKTPIVTTNVIFTTEDGVEYVIKSILNNVIKATAVDFGPIGSTIGAALEPSPAVLDVEKFTISKLVKTGQGTESDEEYRFRIWRSFSTPFSGTVADYYSKLFGNFAESENGFNIRYALVIPRGGHSGAITIIAAKALPNIVGSVNNPSLSITEMRNLEDYFDKKVNGVGGYGNSISPIGHVVRVRGFIETFVSFRFKVIVKNASFVMTNTIKNLIHDATYSYFENIVNDSWPSSTKYNDTSDRIAIYKIKYFTNNHEVAVFNKLDTNRAMDANLSQLVSIKIQTVNGGVQEDFVIESTGTTATMPLYKESNSVFISEV